MLTENIKNEISLFRRKKEYNFVLEWVVSGWEKGQINNEHKQWYKVIEKKTWEFCMWSELIKLDCI